ncbi:MAG: DUF362 domain-containing protein [Bacteroidales bacterium]|nr:MAG: DUF362 domain-containing protein [Bacteroidales bacterium]
MRTSSGNRKIIWILIAIVALSAICWDLATSKKYSVEEGTFRYESDFDAITSATTKVAVIPSDYQELSSQVSRSVNPGYEHVEEMVRKAIELQGGLDWVISKGDKVMLKVNLVGEDSPSGQGENTDVRVVKALIKIIDEHTEGDVEILVAEGTARSNDDPEAVSSVWDNSGYQDLLTDSLLSGINFSLININQTIDDLEAVNLGNLGTAAPHNKTYYVHNAELDADVYISIPVLKIHDTGITSALKNQIGTAPAAYYGYNKCAGTQHYGGLVHDVAHRRWTTEEIVDLSTIADIDFVVVDALMCLETYKAYDKYNPNQVRFNTIIAGADPVAVDHICAKLFCLNPDDIAHITLAEKIGLGTNNPDQIEITGANINDVKKQVKKNLAANGLFGQSNRTWVLSQAFSGTEITPQYIENEATLEPVAGENNWSQPVYFFDDRIDLLSYYNDQSDIVTYAFSYFYAPKDQEAELWLGTHEDMYIYINGEQVYSFSGINVYGDNTIITRKEKINIKQGENKLLVKTLNEYGDYSFALNICEVEASTEYSGNRVDGLKFYTDKTAINNLTENSSGKELILRAYPNPVISLAQIEFEIPVTSRTTVDIYDLSGKLISSLLDNYLSAGLHTINWEARNQNGVNVNPGVYICSVRSKNYVNNIKLLVK